MGRFTITPDIIKKAATYLPLLSKVEIIESVAEALLEKVDLAYKDGENVVAVPNRFSIRGAEKRVVMATILAREYLHIWDEGKGAVMGVPDYDEFASSFVLNQLERHKRNKELADIIYDLLTDYRDFCTMLNEKLHQEMEIKNDSTIRTLQAQFSMADPAALEGTMKAILDMAAETERIKASGGDEGVVANAAI